MKNVIQSSLLMFGIPGKNPSSKHRASSEHLANNVLISVPFATKLMGRSVFIREWTKCQRSSVASVSSVCHWRKCRWRPPVRSVTGGLLSSWRLQEEGSPSAGWRKEGQDRRHDKSVVSGRENKRNNRLCSLPLGGVGRGSNNRVIIDETKTNWQTDY